LDPAIQELLSIKVDGIIYVAGHGRIIDCFPEDFKVPAIVVYAYSKSPKFTSVVIDDEKGGYDITQYLISMGHRRIGVIAGTADNLHSQKRMLGYQKALYENQIQYNPGLIRYGDWERQSGCREAEGLINEGVTAIFCMNDTMAAGVYDYLEEHGMKAGEDLSVAGYDNKEVSEYLRPALTTNEISFTEIGTKSAEIMIRSLSSGNDGSEAAEIINIPCRIIKRNSVKKI
jgi:LacI family transcriptional regulator